MHFCFCFYRHLRFILGDDGIGIVGNVFRQGLQEIRIAGIIRPVALDFEVLVYGRYQDVYALVVFENNLFVCILSGFNLDFNHFRIFIENFKFVLLASAFII